MSPDELDAENSFDVIESQVTVPSKGSSSTLDVAEWNIEWFGQSGQGPTDDALQLANARDVIRGTDFDLWALEEIVNITSFNNLKSQLTGYDGFLANDARVTSGSSYYSNGEQKVGILYKTSVITVRGARVILTAYDTAFAGRPPLEVDLTANINGTAMDFTIIVVHAKAMSDVDSYNRRLDASNALKTYLDTQRSTARVMFVGDVNDDLDTSITSGKASPYKNFVDDSADYFWPTKKFSDTNTKTTFSGSQPIDHHMITNELVPNYVANSAEVYRVDSYITSYSTTTSDHLPTLVRYSLAGNEPPPPPGKLIINEILANEPGSDTAGEFIEIVNIGTTSVSLSGYTISDSASTRHAFASGTTVAAGRSIVVYGGASAIPAGITAVAASTGTLAFNNTTDTVTLRDGAGATVDTVSYTTALAGTDGVSMNRNPDASASGTFVLHTQLSSAGSSPGARANGSSF